MQFIGFQLAYIFVLLEQHTNANATHSDYNLPWVPETFLARFPVSVKSL